MKQNLILDSWRQSKFAKRNFYRLEKSITVEYEYKIRFGHPSSFAFVQFDCQPSDELIFESTASWDKNLTPNYIGALEKAICEAIVDSLASVSMFPYCGCSLHLRNVKWDDVSSSEFSFYKATKLALEELIKNGKWKHESIYETKQENLLK